MKVNSYLISDKLELEPIEYSYAVDTIKKHKAKVWIDLYEIENSELEKKLDDLQVTGLSKRLCLESHNSPGFYPMKNHELFVIPIQTETRDNKNMEYHSILCNQDFMLSFRYSSVARFQNTLNIEESESWLPDNSIAGLIAALMFGLSLVSIQKTAKLRDKIVLLEEQMDRDPNKFSIEEISDKRTELLSLESIVQGQLPILETLMSSERSSLVIKNTHEYFIWAAANLKSSYRTIEWLERRIDVLRSFADAHAQDKMNSRLGRLTILSMIFMPMTLMAGIWGMNFTFMPELPLKYGYPMALGSMTLVGVVMYYYFRKRGWFE